MSRIDNIEKSLSILNEFVVLVQKRYEQAANKRIIKQLIVN